VATRVNLAGIHARSPVRRHSIEESIVTEAAAELRMQIFRGAQARKLMESGVMSMRPQDPTQRAGLDALVKAGYLDGDETRVLFSVPGFSLIHAWLKSDYPLLLHSHDTDCLYYIIAGSLRLGTEDLGRGDGFFVPAGARYKYRPGPEGVEVLEFRHATQFDLCNFSTSQAFYDQAVATVAANLENWRHAKRPSEQ
jgi:mannose-6-phosphate isomerase-like protein (cupin superfamily)